MKATGIVRRIDDLGRVVIPKEIRRTLRIREGDPLEIFTARDGEVILKKYSPIGELNEFANEYCEALFETTNHTTIISDRDMIIAIAGGSRKEFLEKRVSPELERIMEGRSPYITKDNAEAIRIFYEDNNQDDYSYQIIYPVIMQGDPIGTIMFISKNPSIVMGELEIKLLEAASQFLSKQMQN